MSDNYWNSMDFDSEGTISTKNSSSPRQYVDPWDLENYAYIRKRMDPQVLSTSPSAAGEPLDASFYYTPFEGDVLEQMPKADKGNAKYAGLAEVDFRNERFQSDSPTYYHQPYCEEQDLYGIPPDYSDMDDQSDRYSPLVTDGSLLYMYETANRYRKMALPRSPAPQAIYSDKIYTSNYEDYYSPKYPIYAPVEDMYYGVRSSTIPIYDDLKINRKPNNFGLSNYGHLKIDYSCSWNSLDRFIGK